MTVSTEMIVLHTTALGDNSVVVHAISRQYGRKGFVARGVGRHGAMSLFLPMNVLDADVVLSTTGSGLCRAMHFALRHPLNGIRNNLYKNAMTMFLSEVLFRVVKEDVADERLFDWCVRDILLLDALETDFSNFHIRFLLEFAVELGFSPNLALLRPFAETHLSHFDRFLTSSFEESMLIPLSGKVRSEMAEEILRYIEKFTESSVNVRSLKVLRELF